VSFLSKIADTTTAAQGTRFHAVITDLTGTPTELVTSDGRIGWQHRTTLWGTPLRSPTDDSEATRCPLRFPGQYADPETGLSYNYFRHYDPETAHYATHDLLGLIPGPNPTAYVQNPYSSTDPLGLAPCKPGETLGDTSRLNGWIPTEVPKESWAVLRDIREAGVEAQGRGPQLMGPSVPQRFDNSGKSGGYKLPEYDSSGTPIRYLEWGTVQSPLNPKWGGERIITGSDGSAYYSPTHYQTYIVMEPGR
jgi:RHS repeat-associated protein